MAGKEERQEDPKANLAAAAKQYGLDPEELNKAIRSWGEKTTDTYEAGLAALYHLPLQRWQCRQGNRTRDAWRIIIRPQHERGR